MILIADSGSTKTAWGVVTDTATLFNLQTQGINPFHQSPDFIRNVLQRELLPVLEGRIPTEIHFYGAGCTPEGSKIVSDCLNALWPTAKPEVCVASDLLGAARALCKHQQGIVSILGTGANSGYYDGSAITIHTAPLGYILGDEGSGAYLGKRLVADYLKRMMPESLSKAFAHEFRLSAETLLDKVYRQPQANRFLASLTPFLAAHRDSDYVHRLLINGFQQFVARNLFAYPSDTVNIVGSIGFIFRNELEEALRHSDFRIGNILRDPLNELINYHTSLH